jgi:hypothetical protein
MRADFVTIITYFGNIPGFYKKNYGAPGVGTKGPILIGLKFTTTRTILNLLKFATGWTEARWKIS